MPVAPPSHPNDRCIPVIHDLTASEAAARIRAGALTSEALVTACLARIDAREAEVGAWQYVARDEALAEARAADRSLPQGPLHGVPVGVKDIIDTADMPTTLGSSIYATRRPAWDAACVAAARAAGAIILGKTVSTEFAGYQQAKTRNPHDVRRTPGGSSSGSAAAVADRMVPIAFGTQTAASVTRPAAFCGVVGYKASFGELSLSGVRPLAQSLDTLGIFARSVADIALMRDVLIGCRGRTKPVALSAPPRLALCRTPLWHLAEPATRDALDVAAARLRTAGARIDPMVLPEPFAALTAAHETIMAYEAARNFVFETTRHADRVSDSFRAMCDAGMRTDRSDYLHARRCVASAVALLPGVLRGYDGLIAPATRGEAPPAESGTGDPVMSRMWTALGVPSLAIPVVRSTPALPVAVQLIAAIDADPQLLALGDWVMQALRVP